MDYKSAGVSDALGDEASEVLYNAAKLTWDNRKDRFGDVIEVSSDFTGLRGINVGELPKGSFMNIGFDGVGTKMELAERTENHSTIAHDLFAMVCDDAVVRGAEPVIIGSILDVNRLEESGENGESYIDFVKQLAEGYVNAANEAGVAVVNGEIAQLGARVSGFGPFNYNWGAGIAWFANRDRVFSGKEIKEGDYLIGFKENGFRSNGLSLVRKIMNEKLGENWHDEFIGAGNLADLALTPSRIYSRAIVEMTGGFEGEQKVEVHGVAHITGGGIPGKLGRILKPSGLGAHISQPYVPCNMMLYCQKMGGVSDEDAYKTWNMGQGMIVITPDPVEVRDIAGDLGIESSVLGEVTKKPGIVIRSRGFFKLGKDISF